MKKLILIMAITASVASACVAPIMPIPPIGCSSSDAVLVRTAGGGCYWVFIGC